MTRDFIFAILFTIIDARGHAQKYRRRTVYIYVCDFCRKERNVAKATHTLSLFTFIQTNALTHSSRLVRKIRNRKRARNFHQIIFYVLIENSAVRLVDEETTRTKINVYAQRKFVCVYVISNFFYSHTRQKKHFFFVLFCSVTSKLLKLSARMQLTVTSRMNCLLK